MKELEQYIACRRLNKLAYSFGINGQKSPGKPGNARPANPVGGPKRRWGPDA